MKDIKFTAKKVDESWKNTVANDGTAPKPEKEVKPPATEAAAQAAESRSSKSAGGEGHAAGKKITLSAFVTSLGMQAMMMMGDIPHPATGKAEQNLDAASELIDIIAMLEEKTRHDCSDAEKNLFGSLLYDLRMHFIEKTNGRT